MPRVRARTAAPAAAFVFAVLACAGARDDVPPAPVAPATRPVAFLAIGDPQLFWGCDYDADGRPGVFDEEDAEYRACADRYVERYVRTLELARAMADRGELDFVWVLGDHTQNRTAYQKKRTRDVLERFPDLDLHLAVGNHDITRQCHHREAFLANAFDQDPGVCAAGRFGTSDRPGDCSRPGWEHWSVRGVHFFSFDSNLWGGRVRKLCDDPITGAFQAEAQAQRAVFAAAVDDALADPGFVRMMTGAHHEVWRSAYTESSIGGKGSYNFDNVFTCENGANAGAQCDAGDDSVCAEGGTCSREDGARQYRRAWRDAMRRVNAETGRCLLVHHFSGHGHRDAEWHQTIDGCEMQFFETVNLNGEPESAPETRRPRRAPSVTRVRAWPDGRVEVERVPLD